MKLLYVATSPVPYVTPVLNALARLVDLQVLYLSPEERTYDFADPWGARAEFPFEYLEAGGINRPIKVARVDLLTYVSRGAARRIAAIDPDVVAVTSWGPHTFEPLSWARRKGVATVMWGESTAWSGLFRGPFSSAARRRSVRRSDAFVSNGSQATSYLAALGAPSSAIVTSCLASHLAGAATPVPDGRRAGPRFLFVGRLVARKRPVEVIRAFAAVRPTLTGATLTVVGEGPLEHRVREVAANVGTSVDVVGRREGQQLLSTYRQSDVLVLPAKREVWGLVVNEALAHGLFVVASNEVGAAHDLVTSENGIVLQADELGRLPRALVEAGRADSSEPSRRARAASVSGCTPERFAHDWATAAERAIELRASPPKASPYRRRLLASGHGQGGEMPRHREPSTHGSERWQS
jgi:glycosyltransferase involved in cell wall biosynthesis